MFWRILRRGWCWLVGHDDTRLTVSAREVARGGGVDLVTCRERCMRCDVVLAENHELLVMRPGHGIVTGQDLARALRQNVDFTNSGG